jgi:2-amino-4-hydroxy-6-hydroxymethyldihydropteridine diphosphokinase
VISGPDRRKEKRLQVTDTLTHAIALGSNEGEREAHLRAAVEAISRLGSLLAVSPLFETDPVGPADGRFLNAALLLGCTLEPEAVMAELLRIEASLGRVRRERWGNRVIDLDLLLSSERVLTTPVCTVPHPLFHRRGFVLAPLVTIASRMRVPTLEETVQELYTAWLAQDGRGVRLHPATLAVWVPLSFDLSACGSALCNAG